MNLQNKGISLVEVLTVIAIIAILSLIIFPNLAAYNKNQDLKNSTKEVIARLKLAQQYAVTEQVKYSISVDLQNSSYQLLKKGSPDVVVESFQLADQLIFSDTEGLVNDEAVFNQSGAVDYSGDIFLWQNNTGFKTQIIIKPSGYVVWQNVAE